MKKRLMIAGLLLASVASSYGTVVAAWDLSSSKNMAGGVPTGWTKWDNGALVTNHTASTAGGLTITHTSTAVANPYANAQALIGNTETFNVYSNAPSLYAFADYTSGASRNVLGDAVVSLGAGSQQKLTISGLTAGQQYQIQLVGTFQLVSPLTNQFINVTQDGAAAAQITTVGFGDSSVARVVFSSYYLFTATALDTDVQFGFASGSGLQNKNGISAVMVNTIPEPATMSMLGLAGMTILFIRRWMNR